MPNTNHRKKSLRQTVRRTMRNRSRKSAMRTAIRRVREAVEGGDAAAVEQAVVLAYKRIDKCAKDNAIHANTASRRKALVARTANRVLLTR